MSTPRRIRARTPASSVSGTTRDVNERGVSKPLQAESACGPMSDLSRTLREAREAAGLSLSGMAKRAGYSRSYLGNVETGTRPATPAVIRAYERALHEAD